MHRYRERQRSILSLAVIKNKNIKRRIFRSIYNKSEMFRFRGVSVENVCIVLYYGSVKEVGSIFAMWQDIILFALPTINSIS